MINNRSLTAKIPEPPTSKEHLKESILWWNVSRKDLDYWLIEDTDSFNSAKDNGVNLVQLSWIIELMIQMDLVSISLAW